MRLDHVNIVVTDMECAEQFYGGVLGLRRGFERLLEGEWIERVTGIPGARAQCVFYEPEGGGRIELLQYITPQGELLPSNGLPYTPGVRHLAFEVDDLEEAVRHLRAHNVPVEEIRIDSITGKRFTFFPDPDDLPLELYER